MSQVEMELADLATGLEGDCVDGDAGVARVRAEIDRVGLTGWDVRADPGIDGDDTCASAVVAETESVIYVRGFGRRPPLARQFISLARAIEGAITSDCLALDAAADVARRVAGATVITFDDGTTTRFTEESRGLMLFTYAEPDLSCTSVHIQAGGAYLVYLRGPQR